MDNATGTSGRAKTYMYESMSEGSVTPEREHAFSVAYNDNFFLRGKENNSSLDQVCTSRSDFSTQTWRYNLYHTENGTFNQNTVTAGQRVAPNSGFPFNFTDDNSETHFGHIGYWGIWTEDDLALTELADRTISREQFGNTAAPQQYTIKVSGGKLWRRTKVASSYGEVVGVDLNWWGDPNDPDCGGPCNEGDYRAQVVDNGGGSYKPDGNR